MKKELEKEIFGKYPNLYVDKDVSMQYSLVCFGFEFGDGWYNLVDELSSELEKLIIKFKEEFPGEEGFPKAFQMKEKFGSLSFYMMGSTGEMHNVIHEYEKKSCTTCEYCGGKGEIVGERWLKCLCEKCQEKKS